MKGFRGRSGPTSVAGARIHTFCILLASLTLGLEFIVRGYQPQHELCRVLGRGRVLGRILGPPPAQAPPRPATALPVTRSARRSRTPRRRRTRRGSSAGGLAQTDKMAAFMITSTSGSWVASCSTSMKWQRRHIS